MGHNIFQHQLLKKILSNDDFQKLDKGSCAVANKQSKAKKMKIKKELSFVKGMSYFFNSKAFL